MRRPDTINRRPINHSHPQGSPRRGCAWRLLPRDFPNWKTVYGLFFRWRNDGTWKRINAALARRVRQAAGKKATPSVAVIDSQSVKTTDVGGERGYDAGKKITGRKRHLAVDTLGLILAVVVQGADWQDHDGACLVLMQLKLCFRRLKVIFADSAYGRNGLPEWVRTTCGWILQTVLRPLGVKGFVVLPNRWKLKHISSSLRAVFQRDGNWYSLMYVINQERTDLPPMVRQYLETFGGIKQRARTTRVRDRD